MEEGLKLGFLQVLGAYPLLSSLAIGVSIARTKPRLAEQWMSSMCQHCLLEDRIHRRDGAFCPRLASKAASAAFTASGVAAEAKAPPKRRTPSLPTPRWNCCGKAMPAMSRAYPSGTTSNTSAKRWSADKKSLCGNPELRGSRIAPEYAFDSGRGISSSAASQEISPMTTSSRVSNMPSQIWERR